MPAHTHAGADTARAADELATVLSAADGVSSVATPGRGEDETGDEPPAAEESQIAGPKAAVFAKGSKVRIHGIRSKPELNDTIGIIVGPLKDGRYPVALRGASRNCVLLH